MNFISTILQDRREEHALKARRMQVMRDIIAVLGSAPFIPDPFIDHKTIKCDFDNEEWLIDQMEKVPKFISKLIEERSTNSKVRNEQRNSLDELIAKIDDIYKNVKMVKFKNEVLVHENQRLKEENELLKSDKVKVVILRE
jgi:hypothetical protein